MKSDPIAVNGPELHALQPGRVVREPHSKDRLCGQHLRFVTGHVAKPGLGSGCIGSRVRVSGLGFRRFRGLGGLGV